MLLPEQMMHCLLFFKNPSLKHTRFGIQVLYFNHEKGIHEKVCSKMILLLNPEAKKNYIEHYSSLLEHKDGSFLFFFHAILIFTLEVE